MYFNVQGLVTTPDSRQAFASLPRSVTSDFYPNLPLQAHAFSQQPQPGLGITPSPNPNLFLLAQPSQAGTSMHSLPLTPTPCPGKSALPFPSPY